MPLIEIKTYKPVCDRCHKVGSTWRTLPETDRDKAVPPGWQWVADVDWRPFPNDDQIGMKRKLICDGCIDHFLQPNNDSEEPALHSSLPCDPATEAAKAAAQAQRQYEAKQAKVM